MNMVCGDGGHDIIIKKKNKTKTFCYDAGIIHCNQFAIKLDAAATAAAVATLKLLLVEFRFFCFIDVVVVVVDCCCCCCCCFNDRFNFAKSNFSVCLLLY